MTTDDVWFDYFVLRLSRQDLGRDELSGMVERLGSGEKRRFDTGEQLIELVRLWSGRGDGAHDRASAKETRSYGANG